MLHVGWSVTFRAFLLQQGGGSLMKPGWTTVTSNTCSQQDSPSLPLRARHEWRVCLCVSSCESEVYLTKESGWAQTFVVYKNSLVVWQLLHISVCFKETSLISLSSQQRALRCFVIHRRHFITKAIYLSWLNPIRLRNRKFCTDTPTLCFFFFFINLFWNKDPAELRSHFVLIWKSQCVLCLPND